MGFRISYVAAALPLERLAGTMGLTLGPSLSDMPADDRPWGAQLASGTALVLLWDMKAPDTHGAALASLSAEADVHAAVLSETTMFAEARCWSGGQRAWRVWHEGDGDDPYHLATEGTLPDDFAQIRDGAMAEQREEAAAGEEVDCIFEIPVTLIENRIGFRYDDALEPDAVEGIWQLQR
ncbi:MAG: hypothetical protein AAFP17_05920 [Pseudomonadota bacterium]